MNSYAIVYSRLSRSSDDKNLSLDSQESFNSNFIRAKGFKIIKSVKDVGSAFRSSQTELKTLLRNSKNKTIVVYEASRLSRNTQNFVEMVEICKKNNIKVAVANIDQIFDFSRPRDTYKLLFDLIEKSEKESRDIGDRIRRTMAHKRQHKVPYGQIRDALGNVMTNDYEIKVMRLIYLLHTKGSWIADIRNLINELSTCEYIEPFELIEYENDVSYPLNVSKLPYEMSFQNIRDTLNTYQIRKFLNKTFTKWSNNVIYTLFNNYKDNHVCDIFGKKKETKEDSMIVDTLCKGIEDLNKWVTIWYDPKMGLPPNVKLPEGMQLPAYPTTIYIPLSRD